MTDDAVDRVPAGEALAGLSLEPLPEGWTPLGAFVLVACRDDDGERSWSVRVEGLDNDEELLGALSVQVDLLRRRLVSDWE